MRKGISASEKKENDPAPLHKKPMAIFSTGLFSDFTLVLQTLERSKWEEFKHEAAISLAITKREFCSEDYPIHIFLFYDGTFIVTQRGYNSAFTPVLETQQAQMLIINISYYQLGFTD